MTHDGSARLPRGATLRAVLVGVVLCITNAYWLAYTSEMMEPVSLLTFLSLFINAVFTLFALVVANAAFARWAPRLALTSQEVLVVYLMVVMVSTIGGHTTMTFLIGIITHPVQFASAENDWTALFGRFIPPWFLPPVEALDAYYKGETTLYLAERLRAWARPVLVWTGFIAVLWYAFLSLCAILQEQWTEREKLVFPITRLPLEMAGVSAGRFWTSRGMWAGFAVAGGIELFAGLRVVFPSVPALRIKGSYFALVTLAFMELMYQLVQVIRPDLTGGTRGMSGIETLTRGAVNGYYLAVTLMVVLTFAAWLLMRTRLGTALWAVGMNEESVRGAGLSSSKLTSARVPP